MFAAIYPVSDMYTIGAVYIGADHGVRYGYSFSEGLDVGLVSSMGPIGQKIRVHLKV
jgi:hypothetical protein